MKAVGVELNVWLVVYSRLRAIWEGVSHLTQFQVKDLWKVCIDNGLIDN